MDREEERVQSELASKLLGGYGALEKYNRQVKDLISWLTDYNQDYVEDNLFRILKAKVDSRVLQTIKDMEPLRVCPFRPLEDKRCPIFTIMKVETEEGEKVMIGIKHYASN